MTLLLAMLTTVGAWATITGSGTQTDPYVLNDAADWATFANSNNANTYWGSNVYVKLSDTWDNSSNAVTAMVGNNYGPKFCGTFNGNGKTLTLALTTDNNEFTAPFRYVNGATIKFLHTAGTVYGGNQKYATGLIGSSYGTVTITSCRSSVAITSDRSNLGNDKRDATHGGFIGVSEGTVTFTNCLFDGSITDAAATNCGGFVGWRNGTLTFNNCLMAGSITLYSTDGSATFNRNGSSTLNNCYYKTSYGDVQGTAVGEINNATLIDNEHLGSGWEISNNNVVPMMNKYNMAFVTISGLNSKYLYNNGNAIAISYTVTDLGDTQLTPGTHFNAVITKGGETVNSVTDKGDYVLTLTGLSPYTGTKALNFTVADADLTISNADDWNTFANNVSNGETFSGKYVKLASNFDNSATPITRMVGSNEHRFCGTFDGNGKTLTISLSAQTNDCAPFLYVDGATITDLTVAGSVSTPAKFGASIAAHTYGTTNITNCTSTVTITSTATSSDDGTHGGFVAVNEGNATLYFTNCVFRGEMLGGNATSNGGFVGWNSGTKIYYTDCLFAPTQLTMNTESSNTFNRNGNNELTRCYYTEAFGEKQGIRVYTTAQSDFCNKLTLHGSDYYYIGNAVITTPTRYEYNGGSPITVTPAMTYDGVALDADCYTATFTKDGNPVMTVAEKGRYTMTLTGNNSKGYYGSKSISFKVPWADNAPALSSTDGLKKVHLTATNGNYFGVWGQDCQYLFDRDTSTKWYCEGYSIIHRDVFGNYVEFQSTSAFVPKGYSMTTAKDNSDNPGRNPASWKLMGKVNAEDAEWTTIVEEVGDQTMQDVNYTQYDFAVPSTVTTAYQYYRFEIYDTQASINGGIWDMQLSELSLWRAVDPNEPTYAINLPTVQNGTVTAKVEDTEGTTANAGDEVKLTFTWDEGYLFDRDNFSVKDGNNNDVVNKDNGVWGENSCTYTFTMPTSDVTVNATISERTYSIWSKSYGENFKIKVSTEQAAKDQTVTLTITKDANVVMDELTASYSKKTSTSGQLQAPRRRRAPDSQEGYELCYLELTKVDDTHYTFTMPAADVNINAKVHYEGAYAINRAEGLPAEAARILVGGIEATSANEGDEVHLEFNGSVENLSATGVTISDNGGGNYYFIMPAKAVIISADVKFHLSYETSQESGYCSLAASVNNEAVAPFDYVAYGKTVTLTAKSSATNLILSFIDVYWDHGNDERERAVLTKTGETKEEGYPHVYTYTFTMPASYTNIHIYWGNPITVSFAANGGTGEMDNIIVGQRGRIILPECGFTAPDGYYFAGWKDPWSNHLWSVGEEIGLDMFDATITAQWAKNITLANNAENDDEINNNNGMLATVTLSGRTLTKDGNWNTLCLPFDVTAAQMAETTHPLYGATIKELDNSKTGTSLDNGALTLKFKTVTAIEAGKPYIVKWATTGSNISDPVFNDVIISSTAAAEVESEDKNVKFVGQYSPFDITDANKNEILYVASGNKIGYSAKARTLKSCRAHFWVKPKDSNAPAVNSINIDFGDNEVVTGITTTNYTNSTNSDEWYTLDGRKLNAKPNAKGVYINNGRKTVIK